MGRTYAGILGTLGCLTTVAHGLLAGTSDAATLIDAWWCLVTLSVVGAVLGGLAGAVVEEAARKQVEQEWAARKPSAAA
jgi:hypothetical protein